MLLKTEFFFSEVIQSYNIHVIQCSTLELWWCMFISIMNYLEKVSGWIESLIFVSFSWILGSVIIKCYNIYYWFIYVIMVVFMIHFMETWFISTLILLHFLKTRFHEMDSISMFPHIHHFRLRHFYRTKSFLCDPFNILFHPHLIILSNDMVNLF